MASQGPFAATQSENTTVSSSLLGRRRLLGAGLAAAAASLISPAAFASQGPSGERTLAFYNTHTDEKLKATYARGNAFDKGALKDINHILRDFRTGDVHPIDLQLLDLLAELHRKTGSKQPFQIISGYRSPKTNSMLNSESSGVAKRSMHLDGKAIDIRLADVKLRTLHETAVSLKRGGVGMYTASNFVHVDTGRVRYW
ncbi:YcbK family protein [Dongia sedimenti]|uniref:Murein endopeptidase K n=1 Tax=Dongia sedimenti TaxID=3064282 RepID=A0ABU0YJA1_9PROT|nr:DUF882 domain-containing protein [Rhodospirillaceae bacterium R-7]